MYRCIGVRTVYRCVGAKNAERTSIPNAMKNMATSDPAIIGQRLQEEARFASGPITGVIVACDPLV